MPSANPSSSAAAEPSYSVSCDPSRLDVAWVVHSVLGSYWGLHLCAAQIRAALQQSLVFGAYEGQKECPTCGPRRREVIVQDGLHWANAIGYCSNCKGDGFLHRGQQIGLVRIVTDGAIFSSVCDVLVEEAHRGKGVGTALMTAAMAHPSVAGTLCILQARAEAAMWYYKNFDFRLLDPVHGIMQRSPK